jgi:thiol-disulfide isomerase/thioredoxin
MRKLSRSRSLAGLGLYAVLAMAAAWLLVTPRTGAQSVTAQDTPPSIVGSSPLPGLAGGTAWINSPPLTQKQLRGKVVLVDFWDYSCINCIHSVPYVRSWAEKYKDAGLVVIGVHTPEFEVEKQQANVEKAVKKFNLSYPVVLDNNMAIWNAFHNEYWPALYFIDGRGRVRFEHFGEGEYQESERWIEQLLREANGKVMPASLSSGRTH